MAHLWPVGHIVYGEESAQAIDWVQQRETELWTGGVEGVESALETLSLYTESYPDGVRQAPQYFASRIAAMRYADFRARGYPLAAAPSRVRRATSFNRGCAAQAEVGNATTLTPRRRRLARFTVVASAGHGNRLPLHEGSSQYPARYPRALALAALDTWALSRYLEL
jgi:hypothetical protein